MAGGEWSQFAFDDEGHDRKFRSFKTFDAWLVTEMAHWDWLRSAGAPFGNVGENVASAFATLRQQAANTEANGGILADLRPIVETHYSNSGWLRHSEGALANRINAVRQAYGDNPAAFAFAFHRQNVGLQNATHPDHLAAAVVFAMPELGKPEEIARRLQRERANYRSAMGTAMENAQEAAERSAAIERRRFRRATSFLVKQMKRTRDLNRSTRTAAAGAMHDAIGSIREVEASYRTAMGLQAPVEYWTNKAYGHATAEGAGFKRLLWFFPIALLAFVAVFGAAAWLLLRSDTVHQAVYIIVAAGLASIAGLIFWIGRLLTKLYLSQQHLRHDAEERAVMTTTYLALTHESAATEEDKKIILAALFRPTVDGLVKDDGPSDLTLAGMLSKAGVGR